MILPPSYFQHTDVLFIAKELLGKMLFTQFEGEMCGGIITETEAYKGTTDRASHAFGGRRTERNNTMYAAGGVIYVYQCYGVHAMLNIVTGVANTPDAILIRAIEATHGEELMLHRLDKNKMSKQLTNGPGKTAKALGIKKIHNGILLNNNQIWIEDRGDTIAPSQIRITPRIGVDYALEDALLPYRFLLVN